MTPIALPRMTSPHLQDRYPRLWNEMNSCPDLGTLAGPFDLTDFEWSVIEPLLPRKVRGVPRVDDRRVLSGILWRLRTGARWAEIPERYGPYTTCVNRFYRWCKAGHWAHILAAISEAYSGNIQLIELSSIRAYRQATKGGKRRSDPVAWAARPAG